MGTKLYTSFLFSLFFLSISFFSFASTPIIYGDDLTGTISALGESHEYTFQGTAGDRIFIRARGTTGGVDACIELLNPSGASLASDCDDGGYVTIDGYQLTATGTYTIHAKDHEANDTGIYGLSLQVVNNPAFTSSMDCQMDLMGELTHQAEIDAFSYTANAGDVLVMRMRGEASNIESRIRLYDPSGNILSEGISLGGTTTINPFSVTESGTYTVLVYDGNGNDTGNYGFSFQVVNPTVCAENIGCGNFSADINSIAEMHAYAFDAGAGDLIHISMRGTSGLEAELELYNAAGVQLASDDPDGGMASIEDFIIPATGSYFILARDRKGNDTGSYGFSFQNLSAGCATEYTCADGPVAGSFNSLAATNAYSFSGTTGDLIKISMIETDASLEPLLYLYDPINGRILEESASQQIVVNDFELTETGTYVVLVMDNSGNDIGGYTLHIECNDSEPADVTAPVIANCSDATFSCSDINGSASTAGPTPVSMNWGGYNMVITFDNSVEVVSGTCIFGDMTILDNGCGGVKTACYGSTLQFTPNWATCGGPFPALPMTIDFGNDLVATFDENGNATVDSNGGSGGQEAIDDWLSSVTATDDNGDASITNNFDPSGFSCNGGSAGTQVVTFTAVDENNNVSTCQSTITVTDDTAPEFDNQPAYINDITAGDNLPVQETLTATDACGDATVVKSIDPYQVDDCGDYEITYRWTATDGCGNSSEVTRSFNVYFNTDDLADSCPENLTVILGTEGFVQLSAEQFWTSNNSCNFDFISPDDLYFTCDDAGANEIDFSVISNNQLLTVCNFTITIDASNCPDLTPPDYCESYGAASGSKWIQSFEMGTYLNWSGSDDGYGDYTSEVIDLAYPAPISIALDPYKNNNNYNWAIWIDYNQDGAFTDDEQAFSGYGKNTLYGTIDIPATVSPGATRMRVSMKSGNAPDPCSIFHPGEVEDYTINFVGGSNFSGSPTNNNNTPQSNYQALAGPSTQPTVQTYPNPAKDYVMVNMSKFDNKVGVIKIHNSVGMEVWTSGDMQLSNTAYQIDINSLKLPAGIYKVSVIHGKESVSSTIYVNNE